MPDPFDCLPRNFGAGLTKVDRKEGEVPVCVHCHGRLTCQWSFYEHTSGRTYCCRDCAWHGEFRQAHNLDFAAEIWGRYLKAPKDEEGRLLNHFHTYHTFLDTPPGTTEAEFRDWISRTFVTLMADIEAAVAVV